jgi:hypothetical protein
MGISEQNRDKKYFLNFKPKLVGPHPPPILFQNIYFHTCEEFWYRIGDP